jgi:hypothetical protein
MMTNVEGEELLSALDFAISDRYARYYNLVMSYEIA